MEKRDGEPWQDVLDVTSGGSFDFAMAKLAKHKLKQFCKMIRKKANRDG